MCITVLEFQPISWCHTLQIKLGTPRKNARDGKGIGPAFRGLRLRHIRAAALTGSAWQLRKPPCGFVAILQTLFQMSEFGNFWVFPGGGERRPRGFRRVFYEPLRGSCAGPASSA